jgi:hypothetical protein
LSQGNICSGAELLAAVRFCWAYAHAHITGHFKEIDMAIQAYRFAFASTTVLLATIFTSPFAYAQCGCPSGGGDAPKAASGQGQAVPDIVDLAGDPAWQVHESEQGGMRYLQSNNTTNGARVVTTQIGETEWVILTNAQLPVMGRTVYRDGKDEVILYRESNQDRWIVLPAESSR